MDPICMNSKNSKTFDAKKKQIQNDMINMMLYQILAYAIHGKIWKKLNLKYQLWHGMKNLNYVMHHDLYQVFKVILNISVVCINGGTSALFLPFFKLLISLFFILKSSICKFCTLFILLIHSFHTNNINFLNFSRKRFAGTPIYTYYSNITQ